MMAKYSFGKTMEKMLWVTAELLIAGGIVLASENPAWIFLIAPLEGLRNIVKFKMQNKAK